MKFVFILFLLFSYPALSFQESYSIQVFSSQTIEESYKKAEQCSQFESCFIYPVKIKLNCDESCEEKTYYRVFLGIFRSKKDAQDKLKKIKQNSTFSDAFIQKVVK